MSKASVNVRDKRVLLLENNHMMRRLVRDMLLNFRIQPQNIIEVTSVDEALELIYSRPFDMIITDYVLGDLDAADLSRHLRSDAACPNRKIPILLITATPNHEKVLKALEAGVNEVLAKPLAPSALFFRMVSIWSRPRPFVVSSSYIGPSRSVQRLESVERLSRSALRRREWRSVYRGTVTFPETQKRKINPDPFLL